MNTKPKIKILTAGNFKFKTMLETNIKQARKYGYESIVYDLGGLGFGKPFEIDNKSFHEKGYYWIIDESTDRQTRAFHKTAMVKDCLDNTKDFVVYLDGDAILVDKIDEILGDYDVGITVRPPEEVRATHTRFSGKQDIIDGYINAGVIFFNNTEATLRFVDRWTQETEKLMNDQAALNSLLQKHFPLKPNQSIELEGTKIRTFDTRLYNWYYFDKAADLLYKDVKNTNEKRAKIIHYKSGRIRRYFDKQYRPFYFYSARLWNLVKKIAKKCLRMIS